MYVPQGIVENEPLSVYVPAISVVLYIPLQKCMDNAIKAKILDLAKEAFRNKK